MLYAVKMIPKMQVTSSQDVYNQMKQEIKILQKLQDNPHIVYLKSVSRTDHNIYIVMELCQMDMHDYICTKPQKRLSEPETAQFFRHIVKGFKSVYENHIMHRDIKPSNIMLKDSVAKLADFGFSRFFEK